MLAAKTLDRLLTTLNVRLHAFSVCEIANGSRLLFEAMDSAIVHYVLAGEGLFQVGSAPDVRVAAGSIIVVPPGLSQAMIGGNEARRDVKAVDHCHFDVDGLMRFDAADNHDGDFRLICSTISATYAGSFGLFDGLIAPIVDDLTDNPAVRTAFDILLAERSSPDIGTSGVTEAVMKLSLILLVRNHLKRGLLSSPLFASLGDNRMANAVGLVLKEPGADLALADLAAAAGMSRSAFAKAFQSNFDQTPMEFVQKTRLHHAADLLATTDLPVKVIAASLGFASRSHFSRTFRRAYHTDPTRYRDRHTGDISDAPDTAGEA